MEPLAFVEILGRNNEVLARQPVYRWPARVGRGYDMDVILDDPFVAPRHLQIEPITDGMFAVADLHSVNGLSVPPSRKRVSRAEVGPDDVVRLGRIEIRIRTPTYAVRPELPLQSTAFYRRPLAFAIMAGTLLVLFLWNGWIMAIHDEEKLYLAFPLAILVVVVGIWISIWALVSRTVGGRANFSAHGFVACAGLAALGLSGKLIEYLSFGFNARWLGHVGTAAAVGIFAYAIYRHLRLSSRASSRKLGVSAAIVSAVAFGVVAGLQYAGESAREGMQPYDATLKPAVILVVPGVTPEAFLAEGDRLRRVADASARAEP